MEERSVIKQHNGGLIESGDTGLLIKTVCVSPYRLPSAASPAEKEQSDYVIFGIINWNTITWCRSDKCQLKL